jgi:hypothetical protein
MELLVATWTLRIAFLGAIVVGWLTVAAGGTPVDAVDRAALAAFAFTFLGGKLIGWLETPEQKMHRLRARRTRSGKAPKAPKAPKPGKDARANAPAAADSAPKGAPDAIGARSRAA